MKQQSEILNKETKDKEPAQKVEERSASLIKEDPTSKEKVENENIVSLVHGENEKTSEQNTKQQNTEHQNVKILADTEQTTQKADKTEDLRPSEQISKKLEALQENLTASEAEESEKAITELKNPKTAEEEPELAHIAVGKITNWFAKDNNTAPADEGDKKQNEEKEI